MSDIKFFRLSNQTVTEITDAAIALEKPLQHLFEDNLESLLGVRFLASEFTITEERNGTLGLDKNNCPVIIKFKRQPNENIINQGSFYLDWLMDHQTEFELLVMEKVGEKVADAIDWSTPRLMCVAADFTHYDIHTVKQMNQNIELIRYCKFGDDLLMLDLLPDITDTQALSQNNQKHSTQKTIKSLSPKQVVDTKSVLRH